MADSYIEEAEYLWNAPILRALLLMCLSFLSVPMKVMYTFTSHSLSPAAHISFTQFYYLLIPLTACSSFFSDPSSSSIEITSNSLHSSPEQSKQSFSLCLS